MTTSPAHEPVRIVLTPIQRSALVTLVERAEIRGADAALIVGILRALAGGEPIRTGPDARPARPDECREGAN